VTTKHHFDKLGTFAVMGVVASWALGPLAVRFFSSLMDPWLQNALRYSSAMLFLLPFLLFALRKEKVAGKYWFYAFIIAVTVVAMQSCWTSSLYYINPGFSSLLGRMSLFWICLLSFIFFPNERGIFKSFKFWLGMLFGITGVIGVIGFGKDFSLDMCWTGILLVLASSLLWAGYSVSVKYFFNKLNSSIAFGMISLCSVPIFWIIALLFSDFSVLPSLSPTILIMIAGSGIICISIAHTLYHLSTKRLGLVIPVLVLSANPFMVLMLSHIIFGETINLYQIISGVILITGSVLALLSSKLGFLHQDVAKY
jgi:drug/metabolite transporter (DMT)-like permease